MDAQATPKGAWKITFLLFLFMLVNFADKIVVGLAGAPIMDELKLDPEQFGLLGSSFFFLFSISAIIVGFIVAYRANLTNVGGEGQICVGGMIATALSLNPAIPLVKQLTALVAKDNAEAAGFVHWGATSQDVNDTGLVLQMRKAFDLLEADLSSLSESLIQLARKYRSTPIAGRTLMQHALPTTFGMKVAGWLDAVSRHRERMAAVDLEGLLLGVLHALPRHRLEHGGGEDAGELRDVGAAAHAAEQFMDIHAKGLHEAQPDQLAVGGRDGFAAAGIGHRVR